MAYYISLYTDTIFKNIKTTFDNNLIDSANKVVAYFEMINDDNIDNDNFYSNIYEIIDQYHFLYKKWSSKDLLTVVDNILNTLITTMKSCYTGYYVFELSYDNIIPIINDNINKLYNIDKLLCINSILDIYHLLYNFPQSKNYFWSLVSSYTEDKQHLFIILVSCTKKYIMKSTKDITILKQIYYTIDNETIINDVINNKFDLNYMIKILNYIIYSYNKICTNYINLPKNFISLTEEEQYKETINTFIHILDNLSKINKIK